MKKVFESHVHYERPNSLIDSVEAFNRAFDLTNAVKYLFLSLPCYGKLDLTQNVKGLYFKKVYSPNAYCFAGLEHHLDYSQKEMEDSFLKQAEEYYNAGFDGMKMLEGKISERRKYPFKLSDKIFDKYYSFLEENAIPLTIHNGEPSEFWDKSKLSAYAIEQGWFCGEKDLKKNEVHDDIMAVLKKHPKLHLTLAHFGFMGDAPEYAKRFLEDYEYTMFDMTPAGEEYFHMMERFDFWADFFVKHSNRIKYGTDTYNWEKFDSQKEWDFNITYRPYFIQSWASGNGSFQYAGKEIKCAGFSNDVLDKIFFENAYKEYGEPRKINNEYVYNKIKELKTILANSEFDMIDLKTIEKEFGK